MQAQQPPPLHRRRWTRGRVIIVVALVFVELLALTGAVSFFWYRSSLRSEVAALEAEVRAAGHPLSLPELDAWYAEPEQNAAPLILRAAELLKELDPQDRTAKLWKALEEEANSQTPELLAADITAHVAALLPVLTMLREAAEIPDARFPIDIHSGSSVSLGHLKPLQKMVQLAVLASEDALHRGDLVAAANFVMLALRTAQHTKTEPTHMSHLTSIVGYDAAVNSLERLLSSASLPSISLSQLSQEFGRPDIQNHFQHAMIGERTMSCSDVDSMFTRKAFAKMPELLHRLLESQEFQIFAEPIVLREKRAVLLYFRQLLSIRPTDWTAYRKSGLQWRRRTFTPISLMLLPFISLSVPFSTRSEAGLRSAQVAIAVERYRSDHDILPDSLDLLVPAYLPTVPEDPFDGNPLRYKRLDPGYVVYSVWVNQTDEGGTSVKRGSVTLSNVSDWTFRVLR